MEFKRLLVQSLILFASMASGVGAGTLPKINDFILPKPAEYFDLILIEFHTQGNHATLNSVIVANHINVIQLTN